MHAHKDPPRTGRFVALTASNANPAVDFVGGELVMIEGMVGIENGDTDVLIIDGQRYHGVGALRSPPGKQFTGQPLRHSLVHFSRPAAAPLPTAPNASYFTVDCGLGETRSASRALAARTV